LEILPIIIAVAAFLFSSVFDKSKKQAPKKTRPQAPKSVKPDVVREPTVIAAPEKPKKIVQNVEKPLSELERLERENASLQKKIKMMEKQRNRGVQAPIFKKETNADSEGFFTKDNIIQAVVYSEVLASPRARNPHRASMQRKAKNIN
jgi:cell shape-determining protein MreC